MPNQENEDFSGKLRRLIETIDIANMLTSPIIDSIRNLLEVSASMIGSGEASVLVRDGSDGGFDRRARRCEGRRGRDARGAHRAGRPVRRPVRDPSGRVPLTNRAR